MCTAGGTNGATITLLAIGTCTVAADQSGSAIYNAALRVTRSFAVTKADQTITFGPLADVALGPPITVAATASSGLTVDVLHPTPTVCTASGTTITLLARGNVHRRGRSGGQRAVQRRTTGRAELRRRQDGSDHHVRRAAPTWR